jgi:putative endopeptidase
MSRSLAAVCGVILCLTSASAMAQTSLPTDVHYGAWGVDLTTGDRTVAPGDDFFSYVEGAWYAKATIPPDQAWIGAGRDVEERVRSQLRALIEADASAPQTADQMRIGALWRAFMDEGRLEAADQSPLAPDLATVASLKDRADVSLWLAKAYGGYGLPLFSLSVQPDPKRPDLNALYIGQGGLGLPDRDYYLTDEFKPQRDAYFAYIKRTFELIGAPDPEENAKAVLAFETAIARISWASDERRDVVKTTNPMTLAALQAYAPGLDWNAHLAAAGAPGLTRVILAEKSAVKDSADLFARTPLETLKAWAAFHVADGASPYLSKRFVDSRFAFTSKLDGVTEQLPRWKRGVALIDASLGEAVGRDYSARYFPPQAKAATADMVANLKAAMAARIDGATWMAPATKAEARKKLDRMIVEVGYPSKWRNFSALKIDPSDLYGDVARSQAFEWAYSLEDLGKAVDHAKWDMHPQTVNAYNGGQENKVVFPAGILQPPYFDLAADPAVNYGATGATIGHEITHGFDDQGRKIDADGALRDWWTADDARRFEAQSAVFGAQYDTYEPVKGVHINGKLTMGENIADLGGLLAALDAYHASLHGRPAPVIDGLTGDQRFFLAYAQSWQEKDRDDSLRQQLAADPHSPANFRVIGPLRNVDAWYAAFNVGPGSRYYLAPDRRARIW